MGLPVDFDDDTTFVIDSFAALWLQHMLAERHGLDVDVTRAGASSLAALHEHIIVNGIVQPASDDHAR